MNHRQSAAASFGWKCEREDANGNEPLSVARQYKGSRSKCNEILRGWHEYAIRGLDARKPNQTTAAELISSRPTKKGGPALSHRAANSLTRPFF
jgi:hypothetical protein